MNFFFVIKNCYYNKYINFLLVKVFGFGKDWSTGLNARQWLYINFYILFRCIWIFFSYLKKKKRISFRNQWDLRWWQRWESLINLPQRTSNANARDTATRVCRFAAIGACALFEVFFLKFFKHVFHWTKE